MDGWQTVKELPRSACFNFKVVMQYVTTCSLVASAFVAFYSIGHHGHNDCSAAKRVSKQSVLASCFDDSIGNTDNDLYIGYFYAELSKNPAARDFSALNRLNNGHKLKISYGGKSVVARKGDVGAGGPRKPKIDIHLQVAKALGFTSCYSFGIRSVIIESV